MLRRTLFFALLLLPIAAFAESWTRYGVAECIGGSECGGRGHKIRIKLESRPVVGVRFFARDDVGTRADGKLRVRVGDETVGDDIDIKRTGSTITLDVDGLRGNTLTIEAASDDEVKVERVEVLYASDIVRRPGVVDRDRGRGDWDRDRDRDHGRGWDRGGHGRDLGDAGGCIGGSECGGSDARIRIRLKDRPIRSIEFYAHDDVGSKADGKVRVAVDGKTLERFIDVKREGHTHTVDGNGIRGRYLVIEPDSDDEVVVQDIRIRYGW